MALLEPMRSSLRDRFEDLLGHDEAIALMDQFPADERDDLVTVRLLDLRFAESEARMGQQLERVRGDLRGEVQQLVVRR